MTKKISIDQDVYEQLEAKAKKENISVQKYVCKIIHDMIIRQEFEEITVFAPKQLLRLMKDEHYFGTTKEAFLINCLERGIGSELSEMVLEKMHRVEEEYEANINWADLWLSINS